MSVRANSVEVASASADVGIGQVFAAVLDTLRQRKLLLGAAVATALALGIIAIVVIPPSYTAEAYIRGGFVASNAIAKDEDNRTGPFISLDLMRVIETQSRLMESPDLARRVVQNLGLEALRPEISEKYWLPDRFREHPVNAQARPQQDPIDQAAARLLARLSVRSDLLRTYLITVKYTGKNPVLAIAITNAFVAEFLRSSKLQTLYQHRSSAEATLANQLARFGDKHPRVVQAKMQLLATETLLKAQLSESPERLMQGAGENVTRAISVVKSPKPRLLVGIFLSIGLMIGIAVVLWLGRNNWTETFTRYVRPFA